MAVSHQENIVQSFPREDFELLFAANYQTLVAFGLRYLRDLPEVEEVVQDSFIKLWQKWYTIRDKDSCRSWLFAATRNGCLNVLRKKAPVLTGIENITEVESSKDRSPLEQILYSEIVSELHILIGSLPPKCSEIFSRLFVDGYDIHRVSRELQISVNTIKSQKSRGLKLLRTALRVTPILLTQIFLKFTIWI